MSAFAPTPNLLRRWFGDAPESVSILPPDQPVAAAATGVNPTRAIVHTPTTTSPLSSITACSAKLHWFWDVSIGGTGGQLLQRILWSALLLLTAIGFPVVSLPDEPFYIINTIVSVIMFSCMAYALMCMVFSVDVVLLRLVWQQFDSIAMLLCALAVLGLWIKQNLRNDNHLQFGVQIGWAFMWFIMFMLLLSYDAAPVLLRRTKITASMLYIAGTIATVRVLIIHLEMLTIYDLCCLFQWVRFSFYSSHSFSVIDPPLLCALRNPSACVPTHVIIIDCTLLLLVVISEHDMVLIGLIDLQ
jgi:hypothetical protein